MGKPLCRLRRPENVGSNFSVNRQSGHGLRTLLTAYEEDGTRVLE